MNIFNLQYENSIYNTKISPLSALPSVYQFVSCHTLGSTALVLVCVRGHFRVLENEKFSTPREGEPLPHPPQLGRSAPSYVCPPPHFYICCYAYVINIEFRSRSR